MMKITARGQTDVGMKRAHNEDYFNSDDDLKLYVVCDGMGGHASGEVASKLACENIFNFVRQHRGNPDAEMPYTAYGTDDFESVLLSNAVQYGNERVYIEGMKDSKLEGMGTTLVAMMVAGDRMILAHVGDSRIYRFNIGEGELHGLTRDHSLLNHKIDLGELRTEEEIKNFRQGNVIVRAVGLKDEVRPEVQSVPLSKGDVFLLCSDGLSDLVDDWAIENVMVGLSGQLEEAAATFIRMANDRGGKDNITALLVRIDSMHGEDDAAGDYNHDDDHVTEPTIPKIDPVSDGLPQPSWMDDDSSEWREKNDYAAGGDDSSSDVAAPDDEATPVDQWLPNEADTLKLNDSLDEADFQSLRSVQGLYDLEVPEQVALVVLAKRLIAADGSISSSEMTHLNELSSVVGQRVFSQADRVKFPDDNALIGFLNTVHRPSAQQTIFDKLLEIAVSDSMVPAESALLAIVAEAWQVSLPGASKKKKKTPVGGPPPLPNARRAAIVTDPGMQSLGRRVGAAEPADELPSIIIDDEV
jgi:serine/threonine protein phosphatase PrpC